MTIDDIPREHLIAILKERVWFSANRPEFEGNEGYSLAVQEETALRDVMYRDEVLYPTPEEAIVAQWEKHYKTLDRRIRK